MAKVTGPLFSLTAHGTIGKAFTFQQQSHAGSIVKRWAFPRGAPTASQVWRRELYRQALLAWKALSSVEKDSYAERAKPLGLLALNLFLREELAVVVWKIGMGRIGMVKIG